MDCHTPLREYFSKWNLHLFHLSLPTPPHPTDKLLTFSLPQPLLPPLDPLPSPPPLPYPQLTEKRLAISRFMLLGNPMVVPASLPGAHP